VEEGLGHLVRHSHNLVDLARFSFFRLAPFLSSLSPRQQYLFHNRLCVRHTPGPFGAEAPLDAPYSY
jgi:hypothetical protein